VDDFEKYEQMLAGGASHREIYLAAKRDGLDAITSLRMLRTVAGLSLSEAKRVSGSADVFLRPQAVEPGRTVYWEGWTTTEGFYVVQARVAEIRNDAAILADHRKFRVTPDGLDEVPFDGFAAKSMRVSELRKPFGERLAEMVTFLDELSEIRREAV
jgi:hypothetical protein